MTGSACRSMPSGWRRAASSGHRRPTAWSRSRLHRWPIGSTGSTGAIRARHGGRKPPAERPTPSHRRVDLAGADRVRYDSLRGVTTPPGMVADDVEALKAALAAERAARQLAEARVSSAEAMIAH